jgi:prepilin-type N-terminal cleavage/methylation domain-containing protein
MTDHRATPISASSRHGFSLVELLVVIAVVSLLIGLLVPALHRARDSARLTTCRLNLRQLGIGWTMYAGDHKERVMPLAYTSPEDTNGGPFIYWWGDEGGPDRPSDHSVGFIAPYLDASLGQRSVFECPSQPWGTYTPQGPHAQPTTTYGYNGYYLSPSKTPGWSDSIGHRPWRRIFEIARPAQLLVFADTMLPGGGGANARARSSGLIDPPMIYSGGRWSRNPSPTTSFRHSTPKNKPGVNASFRADGSAQARQGLAEHMARNWPTIGSLSSEPSWPYVPDWERW